KMRTVHVAAFNKHIAAAAGNFAPDRHAAVSILHRAIADHKILRSHTHAASVVIAAGLDGNAIVAGIKQTILNQHIVARLRIAAVIVRPVAHDIDAADNYVGGKERMNLPHWRTPDADAFDENILAAMRLNEAGTQVVSVAESALIHRRVVGDH